MLDAATAATLDVDALERRPLCCPRLRWWGSTKSRRRDRDAEDVPTTSLSRFSPLATAWSRASASIDSSRADCFLGET